jgi:hypothetical protein
MGGGVESRPTNCRVAAQHLHDRKIDGVAQVVKLSPNCRYKPESLASESRGTFCLEMQRFAPRYAPRRMPRPDGNLGSRSLMETF